MANTDTQSGTQSGTQSRTDTMDALAGEFKQLRGEFTRIAELLERTARSAGAEAASRARAAGDYVWSETRSHADDVADQVREQPLPAIGIAFIVGLVFGLIFGRR